MSRGFSSNFHPSREVADAGLVGRLSAGVRQRRRLSAARYWLLKAMGFVTAWFFKVLGLLLLGLVPATVMLRPLTPSFDNQVEEPAVFGFLGLSAALLSLMWPGPFGHGDSVASHLLANTPAQARLIYLLPLRQARRSVRWILGLSYFSCCGIALELVKLSPAHTSLYWRLPWGALLLMMLLFAPASVRRWKKSIRWRSPRLMRARGGLGCVPVLGTILAVLAMMAVFLVGDQIAIQMHAWFPMAIPKAEPVGEVLRWLPHAGILAWLNGGAYPWGGTVVATGCGMLTGYLAWQTVRDRHLDQGLDIDPSSCTQEKWVGASTLQAWIAGAGDKQARVQKDPEDADADSLEGTRDEVLDHLRTLLQAQGDEHPSAAFLKHEVDWMPKTMHGFRAAAWWSLAVAGTISCAWWLRTHPGPWPEPMMVSVFFCGLALVIGIAFRALALLGGWQFSFRLPCKWEHVPVDIGPSLEVFLDYDRKQYRHRLVWMLKPLLCLALMGGALELAFPELPMAKALAPYLPRALGVFAAGMLAVISLYRAAVVGVPAMFIRPSLQLFKARLLGGASALCHLAGAVLFAMGVGKVWLLYWLPVPVLMLVGERLRTACFWEKVRVVMFGRVDR